MDKFNRIIVSIQINLVDNIVYILWNIYTINFFWIEYKKVLNQTIYIIFSANHYSIILFIIMIGYLKNSYRFEYLFVDNNKSI